MIQGQPRNQCPGKYGAVANVNDSQIYFIYVARAAPRGQPPASALFSVFSPCTGGVDRSNRDVVARVLAQNPQNAISAANVGTNDFCKLPTVVGSVTTGIAPTETATFTPNNGVRSHTAGIFAFFLLAAMGLSI